MVLHHLPHQILFSITASERKHTYIATDKAVAMHRGRKPLLSQEQKDKIRRSLIIEFTKTPNMTYEGIRKIVCSITGKDLKPQRISELMKQLNLQTKRSALIARKELRDFKAFELPPEGLMPEPSSPALQSFVPRVRPCQMTKFDSLALVAQEELFRLEHSTAPYMGTM